MTASRQIYKFWMVHNMNGQAPKKRHDSYISALAEAERLAEINPGDTIVVLSAIAAVKAFVLPVENLELLPPTDEIPF